MSLLTVPITAARCREGGYRPNPASIPGGPRLTADGTSSWGQLNPLPGRPSSGNLGGASVLQGQGAAGTALMQQPLAAPSGVQITTLQVSHKLVGLAKLSWARKRVVKF